MADLGNALKASEVRASAPSTILLVEDEVLLRMTIADELRELAHNVIEAATADEALTILNSGTEIDLVLTDIKMPGKVDGLTLARSVRDHYPNTKIVVWSGEDPSALDATLFVDAYFSKLCSIEMLVMSIDKLVRRQAS
jgi:CheY-like chemotaxis protein